MAALCNITETASDDAMEEMRLLPCPFCGTADPFRDDLRGSDRDPRNGRTVCCRESTCQAYMFRAQCWHDDEHTRLDTVQEMDAALAERWNRRAKALASAQEKGETDDSRPTDSS